MAISFSITLLLVALITTASHRLTSASEAPAPSPVTPPPSSPSPSPSPSPSASPPLTIHEIQLRNIFDALVGASDFGGWASLLSSANPSALPLTATLFVPSNDALSHLLSAPQFDPLLIPYHMVPQRLTFSDLQQLKTDMRLPTLLPSKFIVVTNNSPDNFTLDESRITRADAFLNAAFALHGIDRVLDYSVYSNGSPHLSPAPMQDLSEGKKRTAPDPVGVESSACRSCSGITVILLTFLCWCFHSMFFGI